MVLKASITRLDKQADALNVRLAAIEARYRAQYTRLDTFIVEHAKHQHVPYTTNCST